MHAQLSRRFKGIRELDLKRDRNYVSLRVIAILLITLRVSLSLHVAYTYHIYKVAITTRIYEANGNVANILVINLIFLNLMLIFFFLDDRPICIANKLDLLRVIFARELCKFSD